MIVEIAVHMAPNERGYRVDMRAIAREQLDALPADDKEW